MKIEKIKKKYWKIALLLLIFLLIPFNIGAEEDKQIMGSFKIEPQSSVNIKKDEYIPIDIVASTLDSKLEWKLSNGKIEGRFANRQFTSDNFIIANGHLYIPIHIFIDNFGIHIEIKGNNYYIYQRPNYYPKLDLEFIINTNKDTYKRNEDIAVSILLINKENYDIDLQYTSSQLYDLVLMRYNREVWRLSSGRGYLTSIGNLNLRPGEFKLYTALINPSKDGYIYYGTYQLYGEIKTSYGSTIRSKLLDIRIE